MHSALEFRRRLIRASHFGRQNVSEYCLDDSPVGLRYNSHRQARKSNNSQRKGIEINGSDKEPRGGE